MGRRSFRTLRLSCLVCLLFLLSTFRDGRVLFLREKQFSAAVFLQPDTLRNLHGNLLHRYLFCVSTLSIDSLDHIYQQSQHLFSRQHLFEIVISISMFSAFAAVVFLSRISIASNRRPTPPPLPPHSPNKKRSAPHFAFSDTSSDRAKA